MLDVTTNAGHLSIKYRDMHNVTAGRLMPAMRRIGIGVTGYIARTYLAKDTLLEPRTGSLRRALRYIVDVLGGSRDVVVRIGFDVSKALYGRIHEYGGTITPKHGKFLTIPLDAAKTAKGVPRFSARELLASPQQFGFDSAFFNAKRTAILGVKGHGASASVVPVFALKTSVKIPARRPLAKGVAAQRAWIVEQLGLEAASAIREGLEE